MNTFAGSSLTRALRDENGQVLPWMTILFVVFLGMAGLTVDLGHAFVCYRELQTSTDAAALAGAYAMAQAGATTATVNSTVTTYSSMTGGVNVSPNLTNVAATPTMMCVATSNYVAASCSASPTGNNVITVVQTSTIPTFFIRALSAIGIPAAKFLTLSATSTASLVGSNTQVNVAVVVDTTASMGQQDKDPNCGNTRIYCALQGVQTMLTGLTPCTSASTKTNCVAFDQVSLFTFPNVTANTASDDTSCPSSNPTIVPYSTPGIGATWSAPSGTNATYQITEYLDDYSSNNRQGGSLNASSALAVATGGSGVSGCSGMQTPGGDGTYYAGVIYAAQSSLNAAQAANPGSQNVMIILSDGDANSTKIANGQHVGNVYGSLDDQCQQAITASNYAASQGTTVYTVAYGAESSGCSTDTSGSYAGISPCTAMQMMSSGWTTGDTSHFYSDSTASSAPGECPSANSGSLDAIFTAITASLSKARLIPNSAV